MPTSRLNLRKALSQSIGDYWTLTATADGNDQKTSHVAAGLANFPGGTDPDAFEGWYDFALSGANAGESKRVASSIPDTNTLLYQEAHGAQTATGDTFEIHRYDPTVKHVAIDIALSELFPFLYLPIRDETLIIDNLLSNSDFETFSAGFTGWTEVGSPTVTQETGRVFHGSSSAKIVAGAAIGQLTQSPTINTHESAGRTVTFKKRVWTDGANRARLRLDWDGTNFANGSYHEGDSAWRLLSVSATIPSTATQVKAICEVAATRTAYFDAGWLALDPIYRYTIPSSLIRGPFQVLQQQDDNAPNGAYYGFQNGSAPTQGMFLRLTGMGLLTLATSDSGTTKIDEPYLRLVTAYAKKNLWELLLARSASENRQSLLENAKLAQMEVERISKQPGIRMPEKSASRGQNAWHVEPADGVRYLVFDGGRG